MLRTIAAPTHKFSDYRSISEPDQYEAVRQLAKRLKGARVLHISATAQGGGVAEILRSYISLLNDLGLKAVWQVLQASHDFFTVTKMIHNGLQGEPMPMSIKQWDTYFTYNSRLADHIDISQWDYIIIHDPQPAAVISYCQLNHIPKWIWRCHIDSRHADSSFIHYFREVLKPYHGLIFTLEKYRFSGLRANNLAIIPPAIDPLSHKNQPLNSDAAKRLVSRYGIDIKRPLVVQVSRFDPWKNQLGTVEAWQLARRQLPGLQLALIGDSADDDPQGKGMLKALRQHTKGMQDLHVIANEADDREVSAFQDVANVVLQRSIREGFGLTVAEALWSSTPVIGSNVGGIPEQIKHGRTGYLVDSSEQAAETILRLVKDKGLAQRMGRRGRQYVKEHFLLPRLIRDDLKFLLSL